MKKSLSFLLTAFLFPGIIHAAEHEKHAHHTNSGLNLSPDVKNLLVQEMQQVRKGMESLVFAIASTNWKRIAETGHNIKHSYIMKNRLTKHQRHELHSKLPAQFKKLDGKFHYYAGMLSHAAREHDMELVNFFVYKMNETCVACHSQFARERFPGFSKKNKHERHKH